MGILSRYITSEVKDLLKDRPFLNKILGLIRSNSTPSQTGHSGEFLTTDGTSTSWAAVAGSNPGIDDVLAVAQHLTTDRTISGDGNNLSIIVPTIDIGATDNITTNITSKYFLGDISIPTDPSPTTVTGAFCTVRNSSTGDTAFVGTGDVTDLIGTTESVVLGHVDGNGNNLLLLADNIAGVPTLRIDSALADVSDTNQLLMTPTTFSVITNGSVSMSMDADTDSFGVRGTHIAFRDIPTTLAADAVYKVTTQGVADYNLYANGEYIISPTTVQTTTNSTTPFATLLTATYLPNSGDTMRLKANIWAKSGNNRVWVAVDSLVKNIGGTISIVGSAADFTKISDGALATSALSVTTDGTTNVVVNVVGIAATTIDWYGEITFRVN